MTRLCSPSPFVMGVYRPHRESAHEPADAFRFSVAFEMTR
jgi:hypothetical protein